MLLKACIIAHYGEDYITYRENFLYYLNSLGYECFAIVPKDQYESQIKQSKFKVYFYKYERNWRFFIYLINTYRAFKQILKNERPTLLFTYKFFPNLIGILAGKKVGIKTIVATLAGIGFLEKKDGSIVIRRLFKIYIAILNKADYVIVQNRDDLEFLLPYFSPDKLFLTNGSGVNKDRFLNKPVIGTDLYLKYGLPENKRFFLFCSRIVPEKGLIELIKAFKIAKQDSSFDFILAIAGWYDDKVVEELMFEVIDNDPSIYVLGYQKDVVPLVQLADCIVLPSYYPEGVPRSLTESLAMGKPIITTDHKGCRETCQDGVNGFLVKPGDVNDLAEKLLKFNSMSEQQIGQMSEASLNLFLEKFEQSKIFRSISDKLNLINE